MYCCVLLYSNRRSLLTLLTVFTTAYVVAEVALTHHKAAKFRKKPAAPGKWQQKTHKQKLARVGGFNY